MLRPRTSLVEGLGGNIDSFNFAFGGTDAYVTLPDNVSIAAAAMAVSAGGEATAWTVVLLTAAQLDAAEKQTTYRSPGNKFSNGAEDESHVKRDTQIPMLHSG